MATRRRAVAVAFTLAVTYPEAGNLGGGGFATVLIEGRSISSTTVSGLPRRPPRTCISMRRPGHPRREHDRCRAVGVPGTVAGLWELHHRFGSCPGRRPGAGDPLCARRISGQRMLAEVRDERARAGRPHQLPRFFSGMHTNETFRQPELEATLRRIAGGAPGFYEGTTATLIAPR